MIKRLLTGVLELMVDVRARKVMKDVAGIVLLTLCAIGLLWQPLAFWMARWGF